MGMQSAVLVGRDHHGVGGLELVGQGPAAIALSRGGAAKTYSYTDPNEDCVAFAVGRGGRLVLAADGHHGDHGSEHAVLSVLEDFAERWTAETPPVTGESGWQSEAVDALMRGNRAILEVAAQQDLPPAPTTFVLALVRPAENLLLHLSVGDSHVFAVDAHEALELGGRNPEWKFTPFLGYEQANAEVIGDYSIIGQRRLDGLRAIVLATDGLSEPGIGVEYPAGAVFTSVTSAILESPEDRRPVDACRNVVETAMQAHRRQQAGDNMGCSVIWLDD